MLVPVAGTIKDLMTSEVLTVAPEDTVGEAAEKMVARGVGSVLVSDYGRLIGILTERDLLRAVADRIHSSEARVREWMTREPVTVQPDTPAEDAARTMLEHGFRHLPVVENEQTIGIVSLRDVLDWSLNQTA
jgi:CBS domain-containing protein